MSVDDDGSSRGKDCFKKYLLSSYCDLLCAGYREAMVLPSRRYLPWPVTQRWECLLTALDSKDLSRGTITCLVSKAKGGILPRPLSPKASDCPGITRLPGDIFSVFLPSTWICLHGCKHFRAVELFRTMLFPRFQTRITLVAVQAALRRAVADVDSIIWW